MILAQRCTLNLWLAILLHMPDVVPLVGMQVFQSLDRTLSTLSLTTGATARLGKSARLNAGRRRGGQSEGLDEHGPRYGLRVLAGLAFQRHRSTRNSG